MSKKKIFNGNCAICGEYRKLSFEHYPPESAGNNKPIKRQKIENKFGFGNPHLTGTFTTAHKGFGANTICETCNNKTGSYYVNAYKDFVDQVNRNFKEENNSNSKNLYRIQPLNIFKQIIVIFLSIDAENSFLRTKINVEEFIFNKHSKEFPTEFKLYMIPYFGNEYFGMGFVQNLYTGIYSSLFRFPPFNFMMRYKGEPLSKDCFEVNEFLNFEYDEYHEMKITNI